MGSRCIVCLRCGALPPEEHQTTGFFALVIKSACNISCHELPVRKHQGKPLAGAGDTGLQNVVVVWWGESALFDGRGSY